MLDRRTDWGDVNVSAMRAEGRRERVRHDMLQGIGLGSRKTVRVELCTSVRHGVRNGLRSGRSAVSDSQRRKRGLKAQRRPYTAD